MHRWRARMHRLQPLAHRVAASGTRGCRLGRGPTSSSGGRQELSDFSCERSAPRRSEVSICRNLSEIVVRSSTKRSVASSCASALVSLPAVAGAATGPCPAGSNSACRPSLSGSCAAGLASAPRCASLRRTASSMRPSNAATCCELETGRPPLGQRASCACCPCACACACSGRRGEAAAGAPACSCVCCACACRIRTPAGACQGDDAGDAGRGGSAAAVAAAGADWCSDRRESEGVPPPVSSGGGSGCARSSQHSSRAKGRELLHMLSSWRSSAAAAGSVLGSSCAAECSK
eukprot:scaffold74117_cov61-Phaeocystis_antarctica.AAC.3